MMAVPAYITEANNLILQANNKDKLNELNESLLLYIAGVRTLINGAKQDTDDRRQHAVRVKKQTLPFVYLLSILLYAAAKNRKVYKKG
eukprot:m.77042 g.77042  ORF g.77042 m.77042 type:complete len:88 (-) comp12598_c0_seq3:2574-2837(-)